MLNFTSYPYQPTGECIRPAKLRIKVWDSFTLPNLCCRNVLTTLSQALASQAFRTQGGVFVSNAEWNNCTGSFVRQDVSAVHCSLNDLYDGSSDCSKVNLAEIKQGKEYQDALNFCSQFGNVSSFDAVCTPCSAAVRNLKQHLLDRYHQKNDNNKTEDSICGVAAVISVAAGNISNAYIDDYFGCMTKFDKFGKKINYFVYVGH